MVGNEKYFEILGIKPTTDQNVIKKAYRRQALKYHPDKNASPDAHFMFIRITEAYEILTGQRKVKSSSGTTYRPKTKEEIIKEKVAAAKARWKAQQAEEERKDREYYQRIAFGWKWRIFQVFAVYTALFSCLLAADYFLEGEQRTFNSSNTDQDVMLDVYDRILKVSDETFMVYNDQFWFDAQGRLPIRANYSYLFHDLKSISIPLEGLPPYDRNSHSNMRMRNYVHFEGKQMYHTTSFNSIYGVFPFLHIIFLVPLALVVFKRPNLRFSIWRLVSIWIIYPTITFFTFSNDRIFYFIDLVLESI